MQGAIGVSWSEAARSRGFLVALFSALIMIAPIAWAMPRFFSYIEAKPGAVPWDPVLPLVGPWDVTWITFTVLYATMLIGVLHALPTPWVFVRALQAYVIMQGVRMLAMAAVTLEPPADIIPLVDPFTSSFYPHGTPFLKDLFFSGHTASLCMVIALARTKGMRAFFITAAAVMGVLVIVQHVHWTIDVIAAPFFVWISWKASAFTLRLCGASV
jgi:hypothetical protein